MKFKASLKHIGKISLVLLLLASYGTPAVSAKSWNWTQAFSVHRALKNSQPSKVMSKTQIQRHHRALLLYEQLRHDNYTPNASLAVLTLVHTNNSNYQATDSTKDYKSDNGYLGFDRILDHDYLNYARQDNSNPNKLTVQSDFLLKFYGVYNFKHSNHAVHNLVRQLSNISENNMHLLTKAENNDIHAVITNLS